MFKYERIDLLEFDKGLIEIICTLRTRMYIHIQIPRMQTRRIHGKTVVKCALLPTCIFLVQTMLVLLEIIVSSVVGKADL